jgi:hypothetical protein
MVMRGAVNIIPAAPVTSKSFAQKNNVVHE